MAGAVFGGAVWGLLLLLALLPAAQGQAYDVVTIANGPIRGWAYNNSRSFFSIPFARPPVGDLRFTSPIDPPAWGPAVLDALEPPVACPGSYVQNAFGLINGIDEDCLYLNVFTPPRARITRPLPVLLWLYGGGFVFGDSWVGGFYDGTYTAETQDVIVVTINYRLASFGFLVLNEGSEGNYGLEDQRQAMYWVRDNIAAFGGDPNRVTLYGESAGGMSVGCHMVSPLSQGLFHGAIMQSDPWAMNYKTRTAASAIGMQLAENLGCAAGAGGSAAQLQCLRAIEWRDVIRNSGRFAYVGKEMLLGDMLTWSPTIDGRNLLETPMSAFSSGRMADVPTIIGTNRDEIQLVVDILNGVGLAIGVNLTLPVYETVYRLIINFVFEDSAVRVLRQYPPLPDNANNYDQLIMIFTHYIMQCPSRAAAIKFVSAGHQSPIFTYRLNHAPDFAPRLGQVFGCFNDMSCHIFEVFFVFHPATVAGVRVSNRFSPEEHTLSDRMIAYWAALATSGDVNDSTPPPALRWPQFSSANQQYLALDLTLSSMPWETELCDFWDSVGYIY